MQYISFQPTTITPPDAAQRLRSEAPIELSAEQTPSASVLNVRLYPHLESHEHAFSSLAALRSEIYLADRDKYRGWKLAMAWFGAIVISWALLVGCVMTLRTLWP